ncbi:hypothetical protein OG2516_01184 [Oceanicola granulosus HTCC2516]|uniref:DUF2852 domain-containing protein n=1 Tax=Oceanicola granulosus (strain ATCC BAA-861 / DSM 15982 / KCTC 12143 / HTCC2516) TaxID=314256 RepID=Q2CJ03_OCEGH|nr:DUF2852 domain-containing protein [Oceanicola granulosus]EAR52797.1 hypothetical protein OG2516_01184 [Oceanicola granulosus HTCC2516]
MSDASLSTPSKSFGARDILSLLGRAEAWLDARGRGAWIVAMILGFVFIWPVGLALLVYMIWSKRMFSRRSPARAMSRPGFAYATRSSGNAAFDAYKAETLRRLEDEQASFEAFLERLREAKDKAEFDQFMEDRARKATHENDAREA